MSSTGPCDLWISRGSIPGATPNFLGHAEDGFTIRWIREYDRHMNDLAGTKIAYDRSYQGREAVLTGVLTRLDWAVLLAAEPTATFGVDLPGDRGTLVMTESQGAIVWLRFPFAAKFAAVPGLVPGVRFPVCTISEESWRDLKPGAVAVPITLEAQSLFDPTVVSSAGLGWGAWTLCDFDMTALPAAGT